MIKIFFISCMCLAITRVRCQVLGDQSNDDDEYISKLTKSTWNRRRPLMVQAFGNLAGRDLHPIRYTSIPQRDIRKLFNLLLILGAELKGLESIQEDQTAGKVNRERRKKVFDKAKRYQSLSQNMVRQWLVKESEDTFTTVPPNEDRTLYNITEAKEGQTLAGETTINATKISTVFMDKFPETSAFVTKLFTEASRKDYPTVDITDRLVSDSSPVSTEPDKISVEVLTEPSPMTSSGWVADETSTKSGTDRYSTLTEAKLEPSSQFYFSSSEPLTEKHTSINFTSTELASGFTEQFTDITLVQITTKTNYNELSIKPNFTSTDIEQNFTNKPPTSKYILPLTDVTFLPSNTTKEVITPMSLMPTITSSEILIESSREGMTESFTESTTVGHLSSPTSIQDLTSLSCREPTDEVESVDLWNEKLHSIQMNMSRLSEELKKCSARQEVYEEVERTSAGLMSLFLEMKEILKNVRRRIQTRQRFSRALNMDTSKAERQELNFKIKLCIDELGMKEVDFQKLISMVKTTSENPMDLALLRRAHCYSLITTKKMESGDPSLEKNGEFLLTSVNKVLTSNFPIMKQKLHKEEEKIKKEKDFLQEQIIDLVKQRKSIMRMKDLQENTSI